VPISRAIQQLIISPEGDYLAITTSHTVHVAILPDSSHLNADDTTPLKLKTFHVGPTTHVLERSPIASVLWHPLSPKGGCLVTVTVDAIARVWELDKDNRWSYDSPALDVDLRKLVNGLSSSEDFSPAKYGANKGFSPDSFEMEVASACFGGSTREGEDPWAAMTLWIAMREGDVYALCPLLPSKWSAPPALVTSLTSTIACITSSETDSSHSQRTRVQLRTWLSDIASQEVVITSESLVSDLQHLHRPLRPGAIPKLQGPFTISPDMDEMYDVTDIFAIPAIENEEVNPSEDGEIADELEPSSASLLCLVTSDAKLHVLAAMATVEGRWLPARKVSQ
jgi:nucleoporin NUP82